MGTWLDTQPWATVDCALTPAGARPDDSGRFGLWIELFDLHLDELRVERFQLEWEWVSAYDRGWSPRTAAFAAWPKHLRPVHLTGHDPVS